MNVTKRLVFVLSALLAPLCSYAQKSLTLDECRSLAISNNKVLEQARLKTGMAHYDRAVARSYYFPNISATGMYMYNTMDVNLVNGGFSEMLRNSGTALQGEISSRITTLQQAIMLSEPLRNEFLKSPLWQTVLGSLSQTDISQAVNAIGGKIDDLLHPDLHNSAVIGISLTQPVFAGGKIVASNRIASLAEELARSGYDTQYQQTIVEVDQAYWQIVSIAAKKELAKTYCEFLSTTEHNAEILVNEGVFTASDQLAVKVKANEAGMMLTQATNGLVLSKMLLCKLTGLPLDSEIFLADESTGEIPLPEMSQEKPMSEIMQTRPELRSLRSAAGIYDQKVKVARADMLPQIALMANYMTTNPSVTNGFRNKFDDFFTAGVVVKVPIFHGLEALNKTRKAKAEAALYHSKFDDTVNLVNLEVTQLHFRRKEAFEKLDMAKSNLQCAEENLRAAMLGFEEGVIESGTALAAQSAWLKANSEYIDAGIELQMVQANINRAEGGIAVH